METVNTSETSRTPRLVMCPYCGHPAKLMRGDEVYTNPYPNAIKSFADRMFWVCTPCSAWVGTHKDSKDAKPLGRLANAELRQYKMSVHAYLDPLWKVHGIKRSTVYFRLARMMGIDVKDCHVGMFDVEQCKLAITVLKEWRKVLGIPERSV